MISIKRNACDETYSVWFLGLNGAIFLFGFFLIEMKNDMYRHMDLTIDTPNRIIHFDHALAITWFKPQGNDDDFNWTALIDNLVYAHSLFLISSALLAIITWPFNKPQSTFTTYCLLLSTAMILRVFALTSYSEPSSRLYSITMNSALKELEWSYRVLSNSSYVSSINSYMINAECCGFHGPLDFLHVNLSIHEKDYLYPFQPYKGADLYFPPQEVIYKFKVPPVCCMPYLFNAGSPKQRFDAVTRCAEGTDRKQQQWTGCLDRVEEHIRDRWLYLTTLLSLMFATEVVSLTIAIFLAFQENKASHSMNGTNRKQVQFNVSSHVSSESDAFRDGSHASSHVVNIPLANKKQIISATRSSILTLGSSVDTYSLAGGSAVDDES